MYMHIGDVCLCVCLIRPKPTGGAGRGGGGGTYFYPVETAGRPPTRHRQLIGVWGRSYTSQHLMWGWNWPHGIDPSLLLSSPAARAVRSASVAQPPSYPCSGKLAYHHVCLWGEWISLLERLWRSSQPYQGPVSLTLSVFISLGFQVGPR